MKKIFWNINDLNVLFNERVKYVKCIKWNCELTKSYLLFILIKIIYFDMFWPQQHCLCIYFHFSSVGFWKLFKSVHNGIYGSNRTVLWAINFYIIRNTVVNLGRHVKTRYHRVPHHPFAVIYFCIPVLYHLPTTVSFLVFMNFKNICSKDTVGWRSIPYNKSFCEYKGRLIITWSLN